MPRPEDIAPNGKAVLSVKEAAELMGVSVPTMYEYAKIKGFPKLKCSKQVMVPYRKFIEWLNDDLVIV